MLNVVNKNIKKIVVVSMLGVSALVIADFLGEFNCGNCRPHEDFDADTHAFIHHEVKTELFTQNGNPDADDGDWDADDWVIITNDNGQSAIWGRKNAFAGISMINVINNCGVSCESQTESPIDEDSGDPFGP